MAVIKEYERQFGANLGDFSGRRASSQDFGFAEGLADLSRGIGQASVAFKNAEEDRELMDAQMKIAQSDLDWDQRLRDVRANAQPGVYTAPQVKDEMSNYFTQMSGNYKSDKARRYVQMQGLNMTEKAVRSSAVFDVDLAVKDKTVKRDNLITTFRDQVYENPARYEELVGRMMFDAQNRIGVFSIPEGADARVSLAMDEEVKKARNSLAFAAGMGEIDNNPATRGALAGAVPSSSVNLIQSVMVREGGFVAADAKRGATKYGINGQANGLSDEQVKNLSKEDAAAIYKKNYWDKYGIGDLPPQTQAVVFDGVVNHRSDFAGQLVAAAKNGATAEQLGQMRTQEYKRLIDSDPATFAKYEKSWMKRVKESVAEVPKEVSIEPPKTIQGAPWYDDLNVEQKVRLLNMAEQKQRKEQAVADKARDAAIADQDAYFSRYLKMPDTVVKAQAFTDLAQRQAYEAKLEAQSLVQSIADEPIDKQIAALERVKPQIGVGMEPGAYSKQEQLYQNAQKILVETNKQRMNDPIGVGFQRSFSTANPIVPLEEFGDASKMVDSLKVRAPQAQAINSSYQTGKTWILMRSEADNVRKTFERMNFQDRSKYLETLKEGIGPDAYNAFVGQVWENNKAIQAAGYMMSKPLDVMVNGVNASTIAQTMLVGEQAMNRVVGKGDADEEKALKNALIPSKAEVRSLLGETMKGVKVSPDTFDALAESVMSYYVGNKIQNEGGGANTKLTGSDSVASNNKKMFKQAVETVLGTPSDMNGTKVLRPWGMSDSDFKDRVNTLIQQNYPDMEDAGLLNVSGAGVYELVQGGVPTGRYIDVSRSNTNYGMEGRGRATVLNEKQGRVATAVRAQGSVIDQLSGGTLNRGGYGNPPTAQEIYAGVGK